MPILVLALTACGQGSTDEAPPPMESPAGSTPLAEETGLHPDCVDMSGGDAVVIAVDLDWDPRCIALAPGQDLTIQNKDGFAHTFTIKAAGIDEKFLGDEEIAIEGVGDATVPGEEIEFVCTLHPGMNGRLNVV